MSRWILYDGGVAEKPLISTQGLPQGDPGAPLMMTLLMFALKLKVEATANVDGPIYHSVYMDDRTVVAKDEASLLRVQKVWKDIAEEYHLLENEDKAQFVREAVTLKF